MFAPQGSPAPQQIRVRDRHAWIRNRRNNFIYFFREDRRGEVFPDGSRSQSVSVWVSEFGAEFASISDARSWVMSMPII